MHSVWDTGRKGCARMTVWIVTDGHSPTSVASVLCHRGPFKVSLWPRCLITAPHGYSLPEEHSYVSWGLLGNSSSSKFSFPHGIQFAVAEVLVTVFGVPACRA